VDAATRGPPARGRLTPTDAPRSLFGVSTSTTRSIGRLSEIAQVMVRHGFGYFFEAHRLSDLLPGRSAEMRLASVAAEHGASSARGQHLREVLDELGPTFVKFGQLLSTRPDVVPPDIVVELRGLQDDVRPFPFEQAERVIEEELGNTLERLFLDFDPTPVAAASIGQVHRATLPNGRRVAVKVQRPGAPRQIEADLGLLDQAARLARERIRAFDFVDTRQLVDEFARMMRKELDYRLEARNAQTFHRNFAGHPHVHVPKVYWQYTRARVLTLEWIDGVQLADIDLLGMTLEERRDLAYRMTEAWMTMIFRHGFFHGDPHPANILVPPEPGAIGLVDFGAVGTLTDDDMSKLTGLFIAVANENIDQVPKRLGDLGVRYPKEREGEFLAELRELYYRYYGASLSEVDPIQVIREGFQLIYSMNLHLPTRFLLLDRAIATLGSVGAELYPDFNVFEVARPYARDLMLERFTPDRVVRRARREALSYAQVILEAPHQFHDFMEEIRDGQIEVGFVHKGLDEFLADMQKVFNRLVIALMVTGGLIGSSLIGIFATGGPEVLGVNVISIIGFALSAVLGVWLLLGVVRSGRL
jgi:ubiquinone biosynthesis protein